MDRIDKKQIEHFKKKGYLIFKNFFTSSDVAKMSEYIDFLINKENEAKYYEISEINKERILIRIENFINENNSKLKNILITPKVIECLTHLFGEPPLLFKDKINFKLPGCKAEKLHQDQAAGWSTYCNYFITMGVVIDENNKENAPVSFMNSGNYKRQLMASEWKPLSENDPPYQPENEYSVLLANPGDVFFFDSYLPHGSPPNKSDHRRRNVYLSFNKHSDGDMRNKYYADKKASYPPNDISSARDIKTYLV